MADLLAELENKGWPERGGSQLSPCEASEGSV